jgi:hypothetical protein
MLTKFTWVPNASNTDGSALTATQLAGLSYVILLDTVNPPVKSYSVPSGKVTPLEGSTTGQVQVLFTDIGFTPVSNVQYFASVEETESFPDGTSATSSPSGQITFTLDGTPNAPTNFSVA